MELRTSLPHPADLDGPPLFAVSPGCAGALALPLRIAALAASLDVNVLLTGAAGTGKSRLARSIHASGPRAAGPFEELDCRARPEARLASQLFGAEAGVARWARHAVPGRIVAAAGGTLVLDEISQLPFGCQGRLLGLLRTRRFTPLGSSVPRAADVRVIATTRVPLERAVVERRFRSDLFYRLQVLCIRLPSLVARDADAPEPG